MLIIFLRSNFLRKKKKKTIYSKFIWINLTILTNRDETEIPLEKEEAE